jgi:hypothetical protein
MPTATLETSHTLRCQLAAESIEATLGIIRGCTVAKAGVQATGKFVFLDAQGAITRDEKLAKKKVPVFTDEQTLATLMTAAKAGPKRIKSREDHDDSVGARIGYADAFKRVSDASGDRVIADIHVFKSYRNREIVLETAKETPEEIGLSIDFTPEFELSGDRALMRVAELHAVDVVDEGAITHEGLFLSARVDSEKKSELAATTEPKTEPLMADTPTPNAEVLAAITAMGKSICDALTGALSKAAPAAGPADESLRAIKAENEKLSASLKEQGEKLSAVTTAIAQQKKERALLGFRGNDVDRARLATAPVEDIEQFNASKKSYLQLVDDHVASTKCKRSDAHSAVQKTEEGKTAYALHLNAKGVTGRMVA